MKIGRECVLTNQVDESPRKSLSTCQISCGIGTCVPRRRAVPLQQNTCEVRKKIEGEEERKRSSKRRRRSSSSSSMRRRRRSKSMGWLTFPDTRRTCRSVRHTPAAHQTGKCFQGTPKRPKRAKAKKRLVRERERGREGERERGREGDRHRGREIDRVRLEREG